jgi:hypothetical protein
MVSAQRAPWNGESRTLIIFIDVGTTFTAASFCILQPGLIPKFEEVCPVFTIFLAHAE